MNPYLQNAFRILGMPGNATRKMIREAQQRLRIRVRAGANASLDDLLSRVSKLVITEADIRDAVNKIEAVTSRLKERLFWFSEDQSSDKLALSRIQDDDFLGAVQIWKEQNSISSLANWARLLHMKILLEDPDCNNDEAWKSVFKNWWGILGKDTFWKYFKALESATDYEPKATDSDFEAFSTIIYDLVLEPSLDLIGSAIKNKNHEVAKRHLETIKASGLPEKYVQALEARLFDDMKVEIEQIAAEITSKIVEASDKEIKREQKAKICEAAYDQYKLQLKPLAEKLANLSDRSSPVILECLEISATCLRTISISYHNDLNDFEISKRLLEEAAQLTHGTFLSERIAEELTVIDQHAEEEKTWKNLKPIKAAPTLTTWNGIGSHLYGKTDYDVSTNSFLTTLYFCIVFIPLFPLARYRVIDAGNGSYRFLGKAPLRKFDKLHLAISLIITVIVAYSFLSNPTPNDSSSTPTSTPSVSQSSNIPVPASPSSPATESNKSNAITQTANITENQDAKKTEIANLGNEIDAEKSQLTLEKSELENLATKLKGYKIELDTTKSKLKRMDEDRNLGMPVDIAEYNKDVDYYNYNLSLLKDGLSTLKASGEKFDSDVNDVNEKVKKYNQMLGSQ